MEDLLNVDGLTVSFRSTSGGAGIFGPARWVKAVDSVSFRVREGEVYGLAGETGSGKSTIARVLVGIYRPTSGTVRVQGITVDYAHPKDLAMLRRNVGIVFQDPVGSLNPRLKVREIVAEAIVACREYDRSKHPPMVENALQIVGLRKSALEAYPRELSGGEKQRVSLARALVVPKKVLILDEPTSSLDVSVQAQVLNLLRELRKELKLSILFITHDINVIRYMTDRLGILFYGKLVEQGPTRDVLSLPRHPYSKKLMSNVLGLKRISVSVGADHGPSSEGCVYNKACPSAFERCGVVPPMYPAGDDAEVACFLHDPSAGH